MKKILSIMVATLISATTFAQLSIWDGTDDVWTKGAGTESSPYLIESAQQLAFIASMVNGGVTTYENTYFKLMTNIDLNNLAWVPIGESTTKCFKGYFDGNNKTIKNSQTTLFGYANSSEISRLNVEMKSIIGVANASYIMYCTNHISSATNGGICGEATNCEVSNCRSVIINKKLEYPGGGIIGYSTSSSISNCRVEGNVALNGYFYSERSNYRNCGGICGVLMGGTVFSCVNKCSILGGTGHREYPYFSLGGIVGCGRGNIKSCCSLDSVAYITEHGDWNHYQIKQLAGLCGLPQGSISINNSFTIMSKLYPPDHLQNVNYADRGGTFSISNSYSIVDKTEQAMKSASFPIVLNTDSTVFIKDVTPNVNDGYPIYANQVYPVTDALTTIEFTSAQLIGHFYALNADSVGFEYKKKNDNTHWYKSIIGQVSGNVITCDLTELTVGTNYVYRVWVERNGVRYFGEEMSFKTLECSKTITPLAASICQGEEYAFNGQLLKTSGAYRDTLVAANGCDSIIELTLTVMPTANIDKYDTIMVGESYDFYGDILTESGNYEHYVPMVNRCNLIILHLYVRQPNVTLTVNVNDPLMGSAEGSGSFEKYTKRTIKAVPNDGYHFIQWNDGNIDNPRIISLTQDTTFTAQFAINQYSISVTCNPQQGFIEGESGTFNHGTELTYKANANEGYHFVQWNDGVKDNPRTIVITKETTLSAEFSLNTYTLSVTCNTAQGRISGTSGVFEHGTSHNFEAIPNTGYHFIQWSDEVIDNPRTIVLTQDSILSAKFAINVYLVQFFGFNDVLIDSQSVEHGKAAVAPEIPSVEHYDFVGWDKEFTNVTADLDVFAIYQENTEGVENVNANALPRKIVIDSQIYILRGDKTYTLQGQEVK